MNPHSVFLRKGYLLPNRFAPLQAPVCADWTMVEEIAAPVFDTVIRQSGWHFIWAQGASVRRGLGTTRESATHRALTHALNALSLRFNAAELDSVQVAKYPGFYMARATVEPRHLQQQGWREKPEASPKKKSPVR